MPFPTAKVPPMKPPVPMPSEGLEGGDNGGPADTDMTAESSEVDPQFAADITQVSIFKDLDDNDLASLQQAILGLLSKG